MNNVTLLDQLLEYSCRELQLSPTNHGIADQRYHSVGEWLAAEGSPLQQLKPIIYPQGSFCIGTTVYPLGRNEHDLDFVCEMAVDYQRMPALDMLNAVEQRLRAHTTYASMVERKKRCIRLNYAGKFHMDILPAAPEVFRHGTEVRVPDRKLEQWTSSNPKGYAEWFKQRSHVVDEKLLSEADIEPLTPHQSVEEKAPLQLVVQLMKRARDRYFINDPDNAPRSIVLTTLAGLVYQGQSSTAQAIHDVLGAINEMATPLGLVVRNPANNQEVLSEQWLIGSAYGRFRQWMQWFFAEWNKVLIPRGIQETERQLSTLFGEDLVSAALRKQVSDVEFLRKSGKLNIARSGLITAAPGILNVRPNTFYGD